MIRSAVALLFLGLSATPSVSEITLSDVRHLLDAGSTSGLEQAMAEIDAMPDLMARAALLRRIEGRLMATTDPGRTATIERWLSDFPNSPHARAASAWMAIKAMETWGDASNPYSEPDQNEQVARWSEARDEAKAKADLALDDAVTPGVLGLDAWLQMQSIGYQEEALDRNAAALVALAPDRASILQILAAKAPHRSINVTAVRPVCEKLAEATEDYDGLRCAIEAAYLYHLPGNLREMAGRLVDQIDDPRLDWVRLENLLWSQLPGADVGDRLISLHQRVIGPETDLVRYLGSARRIAHFAHRPDYLEQGERSAMAEIEDRLTEDPYNHRLLSLKLQLLLAARDRDPESVSLAGAGATWEAAMRYGWPNAELWWLGAQLASAGRDPSDFEPAQPFFENAIAYSGQNLMFILLDFMALDNARSAAEARRASGEIVSPLPNHVLEAVKCPLLRAARTADALCRTGDLSICDPDKPMYANVPEVLRQGQDGLCPAVASARLRSLSYQAIPLDQVVLPWRTAGR